MYIEQRSQNSWITFLHCYDVNRRKMTRFINKNSHNYIINMTKVLI